MARPARVPSTLLAFATIVPVLAGIAWVSVHAVRMGSADSVVHDALRSMAVWSAKRTWPDLDQWLAVRNDLAHAARLAPGDPATRDTLGVLHVQRAGTPQFMDLAHEHFAAALMLRPSSPYSWASIAMARYGLGKTDRIFEAALVNAMRLGPSEAEVQATVADLGLAVWDEVAPATRTAIEQAIGAGMRRNPMEMLQISQRRGRLEPACRHLEGNRRITEPKWLNLCARREITS